LTRAEVAPLLFGCHDCHATPNGSTNPAGDSARITSVDYPAMMTLIEHGSLQPQRLIERTIGLDEAAAMLPGFDRAIVAGMTIVDPAR